MAAIIPEVILFPGGGPSHDVAPIIPIKFDNLGNDRIAVEPLDFRIQLFPYQDKISSDSTSAISGFVTTVATFGHAGL